MHGWECGSVGVCRGMRGSVGVEPQAHDLGRKSVMVDDVCAWFVDTKDPSC